MLTGDEVADDIMNSYKVDTHTYIEVSKDEHENIVLESTRTIDVNEFVPKADINQIPDQPWNLKLLLRFCGDSDRRQSTFYSNSGPRPLDKEAWRALHKRSVRHETAATSYRAKENLQRTAD